MAITSSWTIPAISGAMWNATPLFPKLSARPHTHSPIRLWHDDDNSTLERIESWSCKRQSSIPVNVLRLILNEPSLRYIMKIVLSDTRKVPQVFQKHFEFNKGQMTPCIDDTMYATRAPSCEQTDRYIPYRITVVEKQNPENEGLTVDILFELSRFCLNFGSWDNGLLPLLWAQSPLIRSEVNSIDLAASSNWS